MTGYAYQICGLRVESPVPMSAPECTDTGLTTTRIELDDERAIPFCEPVGAPMARYVERSRGFSFVRRDSGYLFRIFGVCDFSISPDLATGRLSMSPSVGRKFASICLGGTLVSGLALVKAQPVLHAGAAVHEDTTIAIAGGSGSGKSTLLTALCAEGAKLLVDDALRIETRRDESWGYAGANELRLRPRSRSLAQRIPDATLLPTADARYGLRVASAPVNAARLDAVLIPELDRSATATELARLAPREALFRLLALPRLPGTVEAEGRRAMFSTVATLSRQVPVAIVRVPWGPPFAEHLGSDILRQVKHLVSQPSG